MVWMETYLFYCTVRLGVIVIGVLTFLEVFIPDLLIALLGVEIFNPIITLFQNDEHYRDNAVVVKLIHWIENQSQSALICMHVYLVTHILSCLLVVYGALKLKKWLLLPFAMFELIRVVLCLTWHILLMIMLKKILSLGVLIAYTLFGGFLILFLAYNWAASVALFQIITLIRSHRYVALYGDDPYKPLITPSPIEAVRAPNVETVRVLFTPNENDVDEQKYRNARTTKRNRPPPIIAVLPANYNSNSNGFVPIIIGAKQQQQPPPWWQQAQSPQLPRNEANSNNDNTIDYGNWQWAELVVGWPKKRNALIMRNF